MRSRGKNWQVYKTQCLQVSVAGVSDRVAEVEIVEDELDTLRLHSTEAEVARDIGRIRIGIERRMK